MTKYLNIKNGIEIMHATGTTQILAGVGDPSIIGQEATIGSLFLRSDSGGVYSKTGQFDTDWSLSFSGEHSFVKLVDTPTSFSGSGGYIVSVGNTASGVEFTDKIDCGSFI